MSDTFHMRQITIACLLGLALAGGCGGNQGPDGPIKQVDGKSAAELNASHSKFDSAEEPQMTADTRFAAGQLAEAQKNPAAAAQQYREAIKLDSKHKGALYRLAVILTQAKEYDKAIVTWKQYVRATNNAPTSYSNLAFCYELAGQNPKAEEAYKTGINKDPHNEPCRVNYGLMLARNERASEAVAQLSAVLKPAEVHYNIASVYEQVGKKEQARLEYQTALQLDPKFWEAKTRLSKLD